MGVGPLGCWATWVLGHIGVGPRQGRPPRSTPGASHGSPRSPRGFAVALQPHRDGPDAVGRVLGRRRGVDRRQAQGGSQSQWGVRALPSSSVSGAGEAAGRAAPGGGGIIRRPPLGRGRRPSARGDDGGGDGEVVGAPPTPSGDEVVQTTVFSKSPRARAARPSGEARRGTCCGSPYKTGRRATLFWATHPPTQKQRSALSGGYIREGSMRRSARLGIERFSAVARSNAAGGFRFSSDARWPPVRSPSNLHQIAAEAQPTPPPEVRHRLTASRHGGRPACPCELLIERSTPLKCVEARTVDGAAGGRVSLSI